MPTQSKSCLCERPSSGFVLDEVHENAERDYICELYLYPVLVLIFGVGYVLEMCLYDVHASRIGAEEFLRHLDFEVCCIWAVHYDCGPVKSELVYFMLIFL